MAKKTTVKKPAPLTIREVALMSPLAREIGVNTTTLDSAITAGHVETVTLGCGSRAVVIKSAKAWAKSPRKRGRKPSKE